MADFVFDVCRYWIEVFEIDGIRFDYTLGFFDPGNQGERGLPTLLKRLHPTARIPRGNEWYRARCCGHSSGTEQARH